MHILVINIFAALHLIHHMYSWLPSYYLVTVCLVVYNRTSEQLSSNSTCNNCCNGQDY